MYVCNLHSGGGGGGGTKVHNLHSGGGRVLLPFFFVFFSCSRPLTFVLSHKKGERLIAG